jgi:hypothetical protein
MKISENFYKRIPRFCEHYFWNDGNEYLNTISSFFMTYFGILGLFKYSDSLMINILYGFLVSNGFYSALNHWYGIEGWAYVDSLTMILPVSIGLILIINLYLEYHKIAANYKMFFYILYPIIIYLPIIIHRYTNVFPYLFTIMALSLCLFIPVALSIKENENILNLAIGDFIKGLLYFLVGAILWILTEPKCRCKETSIEYKKKLGSLCLHVLWHLFAGYGFYLMINAFDIIVSV